MSRIKDLAEKVSDLGKVGYTTAELLKGYKRTVSMWGIPAHHPQQTTPPPKEAEG